MGYFARTQTLPYLFRMEVGVKTNLTEGLFVLIPVNSLHPQVDLRTQGLTVVKLQANFRRDTGCQNLNTLMITCKSSLGCRFVTKIKVNWSTYLENNAPMTLACSLRSKSKNLKYLAVKRNSIPIVDKKERMGIALFDVYFGSLKHAGDSLCFQY